jgi:hypothetical protein
VPAYKEAMVMSSLAFLIPSCLQHSRDILLLAVDGVLPRMPMRLHSNSC